MITWDTSCVDWEQRLINGESIIPPPIYQDSAEAALNIFKQLRVVDLPNKPTFGEVSEQWVFDFVAAIFGAYDAETGNQLIREFFMLISKKNTKSTIAAGIMLTAVILCWREDEEHLILAPTKEVADNSFKPAAGMVRADEELSDMFHVQDHIRTITHRVSKASLKVVAADTDTVSGKKSGRILVDEHWLFGKKNNAEAMFMEATGGQISRNEGWVIYLSTQSDEPPSGVFKDKLDYYRDVRDGKIVDKKSLPVIYEFPQRMIEDKSYLNPQYFYISNPNLGRSVSKDWLDDNLNKIVNSNSEGIQAFLAKHLNIQIGLNLRKDRWAGADHWEETDSENITLEYILNVCDVVDIGIDGGGLDDLLGLAVIGRHAETHKWLAWCHAWAHPSVLERRKSEAARFRDFSLDGDLTLVNKIGDDVYDVVEICVKVDESGLLDKIGVDPHGLGGILDALIESGIDEDKIIGVSQGWKLQGAIKTAERRLAEGQLIHAKQPLMAWCVGNAKIEPRGNAVLITKQASGFAKIDPLMAMFNAVNLISLNPEPLGGDINGFLSNPIRA